MSEPKFPAPFRWNGRIYFRRSDIENFKRALIAQSTGIRPEPVAVEVETFVPIETFARELGVSRRTLDRHLAEPAPQVA